MRNVERMFEKQSLALVRSFRHFRSGKLVDTGFPETALHTGIWSVG